MFHTVPFQVNSEQQEWFSPDEGILIRKLSEKPTFIKFSKTVFT
jgi:hypothetical protein